MQRRELSRSSLGDASDFAGAHPGKRTLTSRLPASAGGAPVQMAPLPTGPAPAYEDPFALHLMPTASADTAVQRKEEDRAIHRETNAGADVTLHETWVDGKQKMDDVVPIEGSKSTKQVPHREFHTDEKTLDPAVELSPAGLPKSIQSTAQDSFGDVPELYERLRTNKAQFVNAHANYMKLTNGGKDNLKLSKGEKKRLSKASKSADVAEAMGEANDVVHLLPAALAKLSAAQKSGAMASKEVDKALRNIDIHEDRKKIGERQGEIDSLERTKENARLYVGLIVDGFNYIGVVAANTETHWSNQIAENDTFRSGLVNFVTEKIMFSGINEKIARIRRDIGRLEDGIVKAEGKNLDDDFSIALTKLSQANDLVEAEWLTVQKVIQDHRDAYHTAGVAIGTACGAERIGRVVEAIPYAEELAKTSSEIYDMGNALAEHPHRGFAYTIFEKGLYEDPQLGRKLHIGDYADLTEKDVDNATYSEDAEKAQGERAHLEDAITKGKYFRDGLYVAFLVGIAERDTIGARAGEFGKLAKQAEKAAKTLDDRITLSNEH